MERITNIPGYQWRHRSSGDSSSGSIIAIEPVYVVRPNDPQLYWKFTITNVNNAGISATPVASASRPDDIAVFSTRANFELWLYGQVPVAAQNDQGSDVRSELLAIIGRLGDELNALRERVETLPAER